MKCSFIQRIHIKISPEKQSCEREEDVTCSIQAKGAPGDWNSYPFYFLFLFFFIYILLYKWMSFDPIQVNGVTGELSCLLTPSYWCYQIPPLFIFPPFSSYLLMSLVQHIMKLKYHLKVRKVRSTPQSSTNSTLAPSQTPLLEKLRENWLK